MNVQIHNKAYNKESRFTTDFFYSQFLTSSIKHLQTPSSPIKLRHSHHKPTICCFHYGSKHKENIRHISSCVAVGVGFYLIKKGKKLLAGAKMNFALLGFRIHKMNLQEVQFAVKLTAVTIKF